MDVNISIIGQTSVGKTSIAVRFVNDIFNVTVPSTTGAAFLRKTIYSSSGAPQRFRIWDTAGQERFRAVAPMYYRQAAVILICYDMNQPSSFDEVKFWVNKIISEENIQAKIAIVANKCDLENKVGSLGEDFAKENHMQFFEVSAATGIGISEMFTELANLNLSGSGDLPQLTNQITDYNTNPKKGCC